MSGFNDRKDAFESKYAHEEKLSFELEAKVAKIFGLWVAEQLGLEGADAQTYAMAVVDANLDEPGYDDIMRKVRADLAAKDHEVSEHMLEVQLEKALETVRKNENL